MSKDGRTGEGRGLLLEISKGGMWTVHLFGGIGGGGICWSGRGGRTRVTREKKGVIWGGCEPGGDLGVTLKMELRGVRRQGRGGEGRHTLVEKSSCMGDMS